MIWVWILVLAIWQDFKRTVRDFFTAPWRLYRWLRYPNPDGTRRIDLEGSLITLAIFVTTALLWVSGVLQ